MEKKDLIELGNNARADRDPELALKYYMQAIDEDRNNPAAWNNWGNVVRESGEPLAAIPFLIRAIQLAPSMITAHFNLSVAYLLAGNYTLGWPTYEARWQYEHLKDTLPKFNQPRWMGEKLEGKTILVLSEQGHGDTIQFVRYCETLMQGGAKVVVHCDPKLKPLLQTSKWINEVISAGDSIPEFDTWTPIMSIPGILQETLETMVSPLRYLPLNQEKFKEWFDFLGPKVNGTRVGLCWSGRRDTWINLHKAVPFETVLDLVKRTPQHEWINLQLDATQEELDQLAAAGVKIYNDRLTDFAETAGLMENLDIVLGVDTAVTHLAGALGRPAWLMLNKYGQDWRWLLDRGDSPWYPSVRIFRQPKMDDWEPVTKQVEKFLDYFRV